MRQQHTGYFDLDEVVLSKYRISPILQRQISRNGFDNEFMTHVMSEAEHYEYMTSGLINICEETLKRSPTDQYCP